MDLAVELLAIADEMGIQLSLAELYVASGLYVELLSTVDSPQVAMRRAIVDVKRPGVVPINWCGLPEA